MSGVAEEGERFSVTHSAPFKPSDVPAGVVSIDARHYIHVVSAEPNFADTLDVAAGMLNSSEHFLLNEPPPDGAETRTQYRRTVPRDSAEARGALMEILNSRYGFSLTSIS